MSQGQSRASSSRKAEDIQADIARTRRRMGQTLDMLEQRLAPKQLAAEAGRMVKRVASRSKVVQRAAEASSIVRAVLPAMIEPVEPDECEAPMPAARTRGAKGRARRGRAEPTAAKVGRVLAQAAGAALAAGLAIEAMPRPASQAAKSPATPGAQPGRGGTSTRAKKPIKKGAKRASRSRADSTGRSRSSGRGRRAR